MYFSRIGLADSGACGALGQGRAFGAEGRSLSHLLLARRLRVPRRRVLDSGHDAPLVRVVRHSRVPGPQVAEQDGTHRQVDLAARTDESTRLEAVVCDVADRRVRFLRREDLVPGVRVVRSAPELGRAGVLIEVCGIKAVELARQGVREVRRNRTAEKEIQIDYEGRERVDPREVFVNPVRRLPSVGVAQEEDEALRHL